jgi:hypothetical protein
MTDELIFERRNVGPQGAILLRRNVAHEKRCVSTLRYREHPLWSEHVCGLRVEDTQ